MKERYQNNQYSTRLDEVTRPFASGSRQAPDPYDLYLDEHGFYRKHTARDSSSLFRVISEQIYHIQNHHERVRQEVIEYMSKNRQIFERAVKNLDANYDDYLLDMSKPKCRGSHLELKAAGLLYKANVMIFEPFMRGRYLFKYKRQFTRVIRVFFTAPSHYDTVYTKGFIEKAAYCQAIVYEILYEKLFKLPDVKYAVERMLHDATGKTMETHETEDGEKAVAEDGREFLFDKAEGTNCVLGDYKLCHFHNEGGFMAEIDKYKITNAPENCLIEADTLANRTRADYFLHDSKISCVRQLLNEGIAPFPYKVAKALDTSIYRNIEFDSWADWRRESRVKNWYPRDTYLMVGCKCLLRRFDANGEKFQLCVIQEISKDKHDCLVSVEETGEKIFVNSANLKSLSYASYLKLEESYTNRYFYYNNNKNEFIKSYKRENYYKYTSSSVKCDIEFDQISKEIIALPMMIKNSAKTMGKTNPDKETPVVILKGTPKVPVTPSSSPITFLQDTTFASETPEFRMILQRPDVLDRPIVNGTFEAQKIESVITGQHSDPGKINYNAVKSEMADGSDLPTDMATLRFFFNEGVESFNRAKAVGHIANQFSNLTGDVAVASPLTPQSEMTQITKQFDKLKTDDNNNTPTVSATPVSKTHSSASNSNQYHWSETRDGRRPQKHRSMNTGGRGYYHHSGNYYNSRNGGGHQNKRVFHSNDYGRNNNNYHETNNGHKGSTTPTSLASQHSSVYDSGVVTESQVSNTEYTQVVDYTTSNTVVQQQSLVYPQEYDQNNYCVSMPYYYPQPNSVPTTPQVMIPGHDLNAYMYNPASAPVDGSGSQMVEPVYHPYVQPYYYPTAVQQPMPYLTHHLYYPPPPTWGYSAPPSTATSPQVAPLAPVMSNISNVPQ